MTAAPDLRLAVVGAGRMGAALVAALPDAAGPFGRGFDGRGFDAVLLAVPDREISVAAAVVHPGPLVGHCAGAWGLDLLAPHEAFGMHPLMTVTREGAMFAGAGAAGCGETAAGAEVAPSTGVSAFASAGGASATRPDATPGFVDGGDGAAERVDVRHG